MEILLKNKHLLKIDDQDSDLLLGNAWQYSKSHSKFYVRRGVKINGKRIGQYLHRLVMEKIIGRPLLKEEHIDHIDSNSLNNTRQNLRIVSAQDNNKNKQKIKIKSSKYKGVRKRGNSKFSAQIDVNKNRIHLGYFTDEDEAAKAYNQAAIKYFGTYARLNDV